MAITVNAAFSQFLRESVNIDSTVSKAARASRDWLVNQINAIPARDKLFPALNENIHIHYGSFARKTKIRELDDVDMIIGLKGLGITYLEVDGAIQLTVPKDHPMEELCYDDSSILNSRRVINQFVKQLQNVPQYSRSEIKRNGAAAVLNLTSYPWCFDIVPGFITSAEADDRDYYVIPNGGGHWMKTDPRIDQERVSRINQWCDGNVLQPLRLMKYWNRRGTMPSMPSYLLECMVLQYYYSNISASQFSDIEFVGLVAHVISAIFQAVPDPKYIQGDLNTVAMSDRIAISARATLDAERARQARHFESQGDQRSSIAKWGEIFGPAFPRFG